MHGVGITGRIRVRAQGRASTRVTTMLGFYAQMYLCLCVCNVHVVDIMRASFAIYAVCESFFPIRCVMKYSSKLTDSYSGHKDCLSRQNPSKSNHRVDT